MKCSMCNNEIPNGAIACPSCRAPLGPVNQNQQVMSEKNRVTYALLGFFLGNLGVHDFYLGRPGRAFFNIIGNVLISPFLVQVSTGIELLNTTKDKKERCLQGNGTVAIILGVLLIILHLILGVIAALIFLGALALK